MPETLNSLPESSFGTVTIADANGNQEKYVGSHQDEQLVTADPRQCGPGTGVCAENFSYIDMTDNSSDLICADIITFGSKIIQYIYENLLIGWFTVD
jgi:hypothetical protein